MGSRRFAHISPLSNALKAEYKHHQMDLMLHLATSQYLSPVIKRACFPSNASTASSPT